MKTINKPGKIKSLFDLTRISEWWLISFAFILFAFIPYTYRLHNGMTLENLIELFTTTPLYLSILIVFSAQIFLFASNNYYDRHVDALDKSKRLRNPVCTERVTAPEVWVLLIASVVVSLVVSLFFNFLTFIFTAFALFVFYFYTGEPLRFKKRVGLDVLSHAALINTFPFFLALVALWDFHFEAIFLLMLLIIRSAIAQILQEIRDYDVDKKVERNTVIALGKKRAISIILMLWLIITFSTAALMITYQLFGFGLSPFFILILFICLIYSPTIYKLLITKDYRGFIETLWMGSGRTSRRIVTYYSIIFGVYFFIVFFFLL